MSEKNNISVVPWNSKKFEFSTKDVPIKKSYNTNYISFGKNKNEFLLKLVDLYRSCGIHRSIIRKKTEMMSGKGIEQVGEYSIRTEQFLNRINPYQSAYETIRKHSLDFSVFGLGYLKCIYSKDGKSVSEIYHMDSTNVLWVKRNEDNILTHITYNEDWQDYLSKEVTYPVYNPDNVLEIHKIDGEEVNIMVEPIQIKVIVKDDLHMPYYSYQPYTSNITWIEIDILMGEFHLDNLGNGYNPTLYISVPTDEEWTNEKKSEFRNDIVREIKGTKGNKLIVSNHKVGTEYQTKFETLSSPDSDRRYAITHKTAFQQILIAHQVTNENLVGISTPGKLNSSNERFISYEDYYNDVVKPDQEYILNAYNEIFLFNGMNPIRVIKNTPKEHSIDDSILKEILTTKELRTLAGFPEIPDEEINSNKDIIPIS